MTTLILAGGMARRMGEQDKGLIKINGIPMVQHILNQLRPQCEKIFINANRNLDAYGEYGYPIISDIHDGFQGPLAGMHTGLENIQTEWMITVPCDGPILATDYCSRMISIAMIEKTKIAVAYLDERIQPVYVLLHQSLKQSLVEYLHSDDRKIDRWYAQHSFSKVDFSDSKEMFENINTPEQLEKIEERLGEDTLSTN